MKADLSSSYLRTLLRVEIFLTAIESDLEVLGSKFGPDLHEINTQLHQLRSNMEQEHLDGQGSNDGHPDEETLPVPVEPQPADRRGKTPAETLPDPAQ